MVPLVSALGEEGFRALLDGRGILRPGQLTPPGRHTAFTVFAQREDARLDIAALKSHATKFFGIKLGLTVDKKYDDAPPKTDAARIVIAGADGASSGTRLCFARRTIADDLDAADAAENRQGTYGMALLARRCPTLWLVVRESDDDPVALTLAAILASALLGPILSPDGDELFGVRSARQKLTRE